MTSLKFKKRKSTQYLVVHCAATRPSQDIGVKEIGDWHRARGFLGVGYHYVIRRDGTLEVGRPDDVYGAHVSGHNHYSVGICMVGGVSERNVNVPENNFTKEQLVTISQTLSMLKVKYPDAVIQGHRDFPRVAKACPSFDVKEWLETVTFTD